MTHVDGTGTALVVIDVFSRFDFPGGAALARHVRAIAPAIARLRDRFDAQGACVVHTNDNFGHWHQDLDALVAQLQRGQDTSAWLARTLVPAPHHVRLLKPRHSALLGTALPQLLDQLGIGQLVLVGMATDACILATAIEAHMGGYRLWVPRDAVAARTPALQAAALHLLRHGLQAATMASSRVGGLFPDR